MAPAARDLEDPPDPPLRTATSVVEVVADRWARTTGLTWRVLHPVDIMPMRPQHAAEVLAIYQAGLATGNASFESYTPTWERFDACHLRQHRFVACEPQTGAVLGWVALAPVSARNVYRGVAEESVYVRPDAHRSGVGSALLEAAIASSAAGGIWTLQAGSFPENLASVALHRGHGFRIVGVRDRIALHHGRWRNMLLLERRDDRTPPRGRPAPRVLPGEI